MIANSAVPAASTGISPSKASRAARSHRAGTLSLVCNQPCHCFQKATALVTLHELIDTHCHLDTSAFATDREAVLARAAAAGVVGILVPAIRPHTWADVIALRSHVVAIALGIHPQIVPELDPDEAALAPEPLAEAARAAGAIAIGECGLDGATADRDRQEHLLRVHIRAARLAKLPLVVHVLRAHDLAPRVLREERAHEVGGVMHSYSGGAELVPVYRDLGFAFSFAGPVTYPNARKPLEAVRAVPPELLLVETDAPDQSPASHRGSRSEPAFLGEVVAAIAAARGSNPAELGTLTTANARRLFRHWDA
jgi:TatD DNase family protein